MRFPFTRQMMKITPDEMCICGHKYSKHGKFCGKNNVCFECKCMKFKCDDNSPRDKFQKELRKISKESLKHIPPRRKIPKYKISRSKKKKRVSFWEDFWGLDKIDKMMICKHNWHFTKEMHHFKAGIYEGSFAYFVCDMCGKTKKVKMEL